MIFYTYNVQRWDSSNVLLGDVLKNMTKEEIMIRQAIMNHGNLTLHVTYTVNHKKYQISGLCIARKKSGDPMDGYCGIGSSFTIINTKTGIERRVEMTFPLYFPHMSIQILKDTPKKVRRAKSYFVRDRYGKHARLEIRKNRQDKHEALMSRFAKG